MRLFSILGRPAAMFLALVVLVLLTSDASAFGRRCRGSSCSAGRAQPTQGRFVNAPRVTSCGSCSTGSCPTACATSGCANGVCVPNSFPAFVPNSVPQSMPAFGLGNCPNGKCPLVK